MKLLNQFLSALLLTILLALLFCGFYPLITFGLGQLLFPQQANGSLLLHPTNKTTIGSSLIGQNFHGNGYFHPRPSATGNGGYDASHSSGSNLCPTSRQQLDFLHKRDAVYRRENLLSYKLYIPADAVTASASGLDPHISLDNALLQAERIAIARNLSKETIVQLLHSRAIPPLLGLFGAARINVLELNLQLDQLYPRNEQAN